MQNKARRHCGALYFVSASFRRSGFV